MKDNREIAEKRYTRLRKRFQKNPHLFLEYREVLQNYLKQGIIELVPDSDSDSNNVTFYLPHREVIRKDRPFSQLRSQPLVNQALTITLEAIKIFEDASIPLHKWQTNSKSLKKAWQDNGVISDENPLATFEKDNLPYKVLGIAWNSREDFLYFDIKGKYLAKPIDQLTSPLPSDRINQTPAFSVCDLDFAGPLYVNNFGELQKSSIVLFTCGVTRALHLELVSDMITNSFLLAFRRFLARRGNCKVIYSDNAKTFLKSKKVIENLCSILSQSVVQNFIAKERIIWNNIIERSPWWRGFYERLVRSVKESLHKILGKALLSYEEMTTILTEIEAVLILRRLIYVYEESDEPRPLTPIHFLNFGQNQPTYPVTFAEILENASKKSSLLKRKTNSYS
ncbi:integrase catalytic domain-containing protein [Trichonephila clavata]|uniref:Integrase catalytic domain-containing protein n=1 Tax=Trichonephila clavata TaxID=2740835 RepID=A0A8X6KCJ0_TRICU|nr:integrase catalytic domain-containing protein [Trichonephila clavata]